MTSSVSGREPGALVLSLDFELGWGLGDRLVEEPGLGEAVRGGRQVVPRLLRLFATREVRATWAVVGALAVEDPVERRRLRPGFGPDVLYYAPELVDEIAATPGQEVATHTFTHLCCGDGKVTAETFRADLKAARAALEARGVTPRSIVFPRNQRDPALDGILLEEGIRAYRGNPRSWMWRTPDTAAGRHPARRAGRLLNDYVPLDRSPAVPWGEVAREGGLSDVRASFYLRPWTPARRRFERWRLARITDAIEAAARRGELLHLWWHPHNFGRHPEPNLDFLGRLLDAFRACRDRHGMQSLAMVDVDRRVRSVVPV